MKKTALIVMAAAIFGIGPAYITIMAAPKAHAQVSSADVVAAAPFNVVIFVLDCSISFQEPSKAPGMNGKVLALEALQLVQQLFRDTAKQKHRRTQGQDLYFLVAADAASQLIWSGTREQLSELTPDALKRMLALRAQFAWCTDLEAALNEVVGILRRHPNASDAYVLTFSDLLNEPPQGSWRKCAPKSGEPPKGVDWGVLSGTHLGFYFVSKDFPYRPDKQWKAELERRGLQADFLDAAQALTAGVTLSPPPPAVYKPTKEEVAVARGRAEGLMHSLISAVTWLGGVFIVSIVSLFGWVIWTRRRSVRAGGAP